MIDNGDPPVERPGRYDVRSFLLHGGEMEIYQPVLLV